MLDSLLQGLGIKWSAAVGGAIGSMISLTFANGLSKRGKVAMFLGGLAIAGYTTPLVAYAFSIGADHYGGIGLLIGIFGMSAIAALIKALPNIADALPDVIKGRFGK